MRARAASIASASVTRAVASSYRHIRGQSPAQADLSRGPDMRAATAPSSTISCWTFARRRHASLRVLGSGVPGSREWDKDYARMRMTWERHLSASRSRSKAAPTQEAGRAEGSAAAGWIIKATRSLSDLYFPWCAAGKTTLFASGNEADVRQTRRSAFVDAGRPEGCRPGVRRTASNGCRMAPRACAQQDSAAMGKAQKARRRLF